MDKAANAVKIGLKNNLVSVLLGPPVLAFLPALTLGAFWFGGETALIVTSLGLPLIFAACGAFSRDADEAGLPRDAVTGMLLRPAFDASANSIADACKARGFRSAMFMLEMDDYRELIDRHGQAAADLVVQRCGERIVSTLRERDTVARLGDSRFGICLEPVRQLDVELCIQLSSRIQAAVEEPVALDGMTVYMSCSIGFCQFSRAPDPTVDDWKTATAHALAEAQDNAPSGIRSYSPEMMRKTQIESDLREDAIAALDEGQIHPWYQPQISTDTGKVTGFEALARWQHPEHGMISPDKFLPALEAAGLLERLGQVMMYHAFTALKAWDSAGLDVPMVGLNFTTHELRNPGLVDKIRWELDRFDLTPDRLAVEILESVVTDNPDDTVARNISALHDLGCNIDLDDYGTGHASIASIRRFSVARIKVDRSFVMKADRDPDQQRMIAAILTMAERLNIETLAEGVETVGEHTLLAQLGCDHVQGFGIARPMPFEKTHEWITSHTAKLEETPRITRQG